MHIRFSSLAASERYHVMTQIIIPRPIAWILSDNGGESDQDSNSGVTGRYNLAPFSYFNAVSSEPPLVMISVGSKPTGEVKDTRRNILQREHCVIHIPSQDHATEVTQSAATLPHGESEVDALGLALQAVEGWHLPRLMQASIAIACHLYEVKEIGPNKQGLIFLEIDDVYVNDDCVVKDAKGRDKIDAGKIAPLARLGASEYAAFGEVISRARPK